MALVNYFLKKASPWMLNIDTDPKYASLQSQTKQNQLVSVSAFFKYFLFTLTKISQSGFYI